MLQFACYPWPPKVVKAAEEDEMRDLYDYDLSSFRTDELLSVLSEYKGKRLFVAVLGSPDPDGLSSAWTLSILARHVGVRMDILTFEVISRPDNLSFVRFLELPFKRVREKLPRVKYVGYCVVDRQGTSLPVKRRRSLELVAHIDHHRPVRSRAKFKQQLKDVGATASIMAIHLGQTLKELDCDPEELSRVATALMYGIRTDTQNFLIAQQWDFYAASLISHLAYVDVLQNLELTPYGRPFLNALASAIGHSQVVGRAMIAHAGDVGVRARDVIGQTADFLLRTEGITTVCVFGLVGRQIVGSLRTADPDLDTTEFLEKSLSSLSDSQVDCGGRRFAGGFQIPCDKCSSNLAKQVMEALVEGAKEFGL